MTRTSKPTPENEPLSSGGRPKGIPGWLWRLLSLLRASRLGRLALHTANELLRVEIFDRAMTLAAQAFTSVLPLLIMVAALFGAQARAQLLQLLRMPETSARLLEAALSGSRSNAFGAVGGLIVVCSATGLSRALVRAYSAIWSIQQRPARLAATGRQIATVIALAGFLVCVRLLGWLTSELPAPRAAGAAATFLANSALAMLLPRMLLGPVVGRARLLLGGLAFGALMVGVRTAGTAYLPHSLQMSVDRYGTLGLAFAYIGWLYIVAFCLLLAAVSGDVLTDFVDEIRPRHRRTPPEDAPTASAGG